MPQTELWNELSNTLEQLVDEHGLTEIVAALQNVCAEKGEHLQSNWQDQGAAREWWAMAAKFNKLKCGGL